MTRRVCVVVIAIALSTPAFAQTAVNRPLKRYDLFGGVNVLGGAGLGTADANLRANQRTPAPFRLFTTDARFRQTLGFHGGLSYAFSRRIEFEGQVTISRPELESSISGDVEGAPPEAITERVDQYFFDGNVVFMIEEARMGARTIPFAEAGAGYLRQLHEGLTVTEHGEVYHFGGGLKHWFGPVRKGAVKAVGLKTSARAYVLAHGISFDNRPRAHVAISGGLFVTF
jgi:hypothetical protein